MEIENHKEEVPFAHYEALFKDLNPREVLERLPEVGFDGGAFQVTLLGRSFSITYPGYMDSFVAACFLPHTDRSLFPHSIQER